MPDILHGVGAKSAVSDTGKGAPFPDDVHISVNWD
jgi:hypothetical protein